MTPHRQWLTHYRAHRVPVRLGDNSVVWSEGVGVCWFEPMLQGSPTPLVRFSNVLYYQPPSVCHHLVSADYFLEIFDGSKGGSQFYVR